MSRRNTNAAKKPPQSLVEIGQETAIELTEQELNRASGGVRNNKYGKHQTGFN